MYSSFLIGYPPALKKNKKIRHGILPHYKINNSKYIECIMDAKPFVLVYQCHYVNSKAKQICNGPMREIELKYNPFLMYFLRKYIKKGLERSEGPLK
jgi:hypothetical protein